MSEQTFTTESDPKDFTVPEVEAYLATADEAERTRVFGLETGEGGKDREGVKKAATATPEPPAEDDEKTGLESTGNPMDLSTKPDPVDAKVADQEGADPALSEAVKLSEELGYVAPEQNALKPGKPDYSQANPDVMNGGGKS